ncbi:MAG: glycosyltransferase family 4 protein [Candidatus Aegiribacteria sp.]|nr:glycosyltransferase family 4 protein [Candidatus Aegiribacteria sp.]
MLPGNNTCCGFRSSAGDVRVLFDLSIVPHALGGVSRYLLSVAGALLEAADQFGVDFVPLDVPAAHPGVPGPEMDCLLLETPFYLKIPFFRRIPIRKRCEERSRADRLRKIAGGKAVFQHSGVQPEYPAGSISVITMYDLSALEYPQWYTKETVLFAEKEARLIDSGSSVMAISEWTRQRVIDYFGLPPERVFSAGGAADGIFAPGTPSCEVMKNIDLEPGGYLLHVGNFVPRKNIPFLLDVYSMSREKGIDIPLVLVGAGGWGDVEVDEGPGVRVLRNISDRDMLELYRGARALLCPSYFEGLGLPVLEAFACGTPVISSNATALADTVGNNGIMLDPADHQAWVNEITALEEPERVDELRSMSGAAQRKNWQDIARGICGFYRKIAGS